MVEKVIMVPVLLLMFSADSRGALPSRNSGTSTCLGFQKWNDLPAQHPLDGIITPRSSRNGLFGASKPECALSLRGGEDDEEGKDEDEEQTATAGGGETAQDPDGKEEDGPMNLNKALKEVRNPASLDRFHLIQLMFRVL